MIYSPYPTPPAELIDTDPCEASGIQHIKPSTMDKSDLIEPTMTWNQLSGIPEKSYNQLGQTHQAPGKKPGKNSYSKAKPRSLQKKMTDTATYFNNLSIDIPDSSNLKTTALKIFKKKRLGTHSPRGSNDKSSFSRDQSWSYDSRESPNVIFDSKRKLSSTKKQRKKSEKLIDINDGKLKGNWKNIIKGSINFESTLNRSN
jgi:hypothetical protein